jgi:hypothetical protein
MESPERDYRASKVKPLSNIQYAFPSLNSIAHPNLIQSGSDVEGLPFVGPKTLQKVIKRCTHTIMLTRFRFRNTSKQATFEKP